MASNYGKEFKTSASSKAADQEVVSDVVELSPKTKNHVLVVKSDSSVSGAVDVELEMSPDGKNWCPARNKTTASSSSSTGDIIGNEKATRLTDTSKNKYGRGTMNRNLDEDATYNKGTSDEAARTDGADFMYHRIQTTKSFNYSQWIKSSETPSATYNPVLFRHAGYDNFSNAKTAQLTAEDPAGTDIANLKDPMNLSYEWEKVITSGIRPQDSFTIAYWIDVSKLDASATHYPGFSNNETSGTFGIYAGDLLYNNASGGSSNRYYLSMHWRSSIQAANQLDYFNVDRNEAYLIVKRVDASNGNGGTGTIHLDAFKQSDGSSVFNEQTTFTIDTSYAASYGAFTGNVWDAQSGLSKIDELIVLNSCVTDGNLNTLYQTINSKIYPKDFSSTSGALAWYRFGAVGTDTKATVNSAISTSFGILENTSFTSSDAIPSLATTDNLYMAGPLKKTQNLLASGGEQNTNYMHMPTLDSLTSLVRSSASYNASPWYCSTDSSPTQALPDPANGFAVSMWLNRAETTSGSGWRFTNVWVVHFTNGAKIYFQLLHQDSDANSVRRLRMRYKDPSGNGIITEYTGVESTLTGWKHILFYGKGTGTGGDVAASTTDASNDWKIFVDGVELTPASVTNGTTLDSSTSLTVDYIEMREKGDVNNPDTLDDLKIDNLAFFKGNLDTAAIASIYANKNNVELATLPTNTKLTTLFKMGDTSGDVITQDSNLSIRNAISTNDIRLIPETGLTPFAISQYATSDLPYQDTTNSFPAILNTTSNASISGWFKTTDTGTLFSNTGGAAATGFTCEVTTTNIGLSFKDGSPSPIVATTDVDDGEWHHILVTKDTSQEFKIYIDGLLKVTATASGLTNADLGGDNGFTLLGDGQNNATSSYPASTDNGKLNATLSNWSIHSEVLDANAALQLYSNGHVRNIKNLPSVDTTKIKAWWQLADNTNPQNDIVGDNHLLFFEPGYSNKKGVRKTSATADNNTSGINSATTISSALSSNWSISFWFKSNSDLSGGNITLDDYRYDMHLIGSDTVSGGSSDWITGFSLGVRGSNFKVNYASSSSDFYQYTVSGANAAIFDGEWHNITIVHSGTTASKADWYSNLKIYIDGGSSLTKSADYEAGTPGTVTAIKPFWGKGTNTSTGTNVINHVSGMIHSYDEMALWSGTALNATARTALYNSGKPTDLQNTTNVTVPTVYYRGEHTDVGYETIAGSATTNEVNVEAVTLATSGTGNIYVANSASLATKLVNATGATLVNDAINGHGMTMSITKSFNFTTKKWVSTYDQDAAICLSFNGFEDQAEYFALWKCSQNLPGASAVNVLDGNFHNIILSYRGKENFSGNNVDPGDVVKFGPGDANQHYHWTLSIDGVETTTINGGSGIDYIGGLNTVTTSTYGGTPYNVGFAIQDRHLKHTIANTEEVYKPHTQFSSGILDGAGANKHAFQGDVDETSFHSDTWWVNSAGTLVSPNNFNGEKPATMYGNTGALGNRGTGKEYPVGVPYPLRNPEKLVTSGTASDIEGTNQYINPLPFNSGSNANGGLEGFWRWGDTSGDCSEAINDVKSHADGNDNNDLEVENITTGDLVVLTESDPTYLASSTVSSGGTTTSFEVIKLENIASGLQLANLDSPIFSLLRVKWKGAGTINLGRDTAIAKIYFTNRRRRRNN